MSASNGAAAADSAEVLGASLPPPVATDDDNCSHSSSDISTSDLMIPGSHAEAKWAYESQGLTMSNGDTDCSVERGARMHIEEVLGEWTRVVTLGLSSGVVPLGHLAPLRYVQSLYRYAPNGAVMSTGDVDIGFSKGDVMLVLAELPSDWLRVQHDANGVGVVPATYVEPLLPPYDFPPPDRSVVEQEATSRATRRRTLMMSKRTASPAGSPLRASSGSVAKRPGKKGSSSLDRGQSGAQKKKETVKPEGVPRTSSDSNLSLHVPAQPFRPQRTARGSVGRSGSLIALAAADRDKALRQTPVWPKSYPFAERDSPSNLLFLEDLVDGQPQVKAATLNKLVERLTLPDYVEPNFTQNFLLTYRSFATREEFFDVLVQRFQVPDPPLNLGEKAPPELSEAELEEQLGIYFHKVIKPIQLRVFNVIKKWVEDYFYDFAERPELAAKLRQFVEGDLSNASMDTAVKSLTRILEKRETAARKATKDDNDDGWYEDDYNFAESPPPAIMPDAKGLAKVDASLTLFQYAPEEIARQLCLIDHNLFRRIRPSEGLGQKWSKPATQNQVPNVMASIRQFNKLSLFVASSVIMIPDKTKRAKMLELWIDTAQFLKDMNNFNALMAVLAGLRQSAVHRLTKTWKKLSKHGARTFQDLIDAMSPEFNYRNYRGQLKSVSPPCVPYLGVYLTDLTFIEDGNPDTLLGAARGGARRRTKTPVEPVKLINFDKRRRISKVLQDIRVYQHARYNFTEVPLIQGSLLAGGEFVDEEKMYELSLAIEPRKGSKLGTKEMQKSVHGLKGVHALSVTNVLSLPSTPTKADMPDDNSYKPEATMDDLVSLVMQDGGETALDGELAERDLTTEQRESLKEQVLRLSELKRKNEHAQRVDDTFLTEPVDADDDQAGRAKIFEKLVGWLLAGDIASFDEYLSGLGLFQAQRMRDQAMALLQQELKAREARKG